MKQEINLSESTPFIILCVIVASPSADSLGAFHLRTHMWGFSICFVVSIGKRSQNWGTLQHWDTLLEAAFPSGNQWHPVSGLGPALAVWQKCHRCKEARRWRHRPSLARPFSLGHGCKTQRGGTLLFGDPGRGFITTKVHIAPSPVGIQSAMGTAVEHPRPPRCSRVRCLPAPCWATWDHRSLEPSRRILPAASQHGNKYCQGNEKQTNLLSPVLRSPSSPVTALSTRPSALLIQVLPHRAPSAASCKHHMLWTEVDVGCVQSYPPQRSFLARYLSLREKLIRVRQFDRVPCNHYQRTLR